MTTQETPPNAGRRLFLFRLVEWAFGLSIVGFLIPVIEYLSPKPREGAANTLMDPGGNPVKPDDVAKEGFKMGLAFGEPTIVIVDQGALKAYSAVCTHLGCIVGWRPNQKDFFCPCHAGRFDSNGGVLSGPPPRPLKKYRVQVTANRIQLFEV